MDRRLFGSCFPLDVRPFVRPCRLQSSDRTRPLRLSSEQHDWRDDHVPSASSHAGIWPEVSSLSASDFTALLFVVPYVASAPPAVAERSTFHPRNITLFGSILTHSVLGNCEIRLLWRTMRCRYKLATESLHRLFQLFVFLGRPFREDLGQMKPASLPDAVENVASG